MNPLHFFPLGRRSRNARTPNDVGFQFLRGMIGLIAVWLLLMPVVPKIAVTTLRRFHLRGSSFATWAAQFPIPAMYNFRNTYEVRKWPEGAMEGLPVMIDDRTGVVDSGTINHFPARVITFGRQRYRYLKRDNGEGETREDRWFRLRSSYRGTELVTRVQLHAEPDGTFTYLRSPVDGEAR